MATIYWIGKATAIAQQVQATPGGTIGTEIFTLNVGNASISYTAQSGDNATDVTNGLKDAWNSSTHPYIAAVTASEVDGAVILKADVPGVPFTVEAAVSGAATLVLTTSQVNAGPNDWSTAANWSSGIVPANDDTVHIEHCSDSILWGLDQSNVVLNELCIAQSFTGLLGLPSSVFTLTADEVDDIKPEYRTCELTIGTQSIRIGEHHGSGAPAGSGRIRLNTLNTATELNVINTASAANDVNSEPLHWRGDHNGNTIHISRGRLSIAGSHAGETATVATLNVGHRGNLNADAVVHIGEAASIDTLNQSGGNVHIGCDITTVNQHAGTLRTYGDAALTTAVIGGIAYLNAAGSITNLHVRGGGIADFSHDAREKTITNCHLHRGATLDLNNGNPQSITFSNDLAFEQCEPRDITLSTGPNIRVSVASI